MWAGIAGFREDCALETATASCCLNLDPNTTRMTQVLCIEICLAGVQQPSLSGAASPPTTTNLQQPLPTGGTVDHRRAPSTTTLPEVSVTTSVLREEPDPPTAANHPQLPPATVSVTASVLHEEPDPNAELLLRRTSDGRFIVLESKGTVGTVCYYMLLLPTS